MAALAAPPCGLAAYGLHAGGLQALVHARVPHGRYAGVRGGQVVVAGEHLATRAVRAARVRLALARSVHYEAGPLVALLALPPDALVGVGDHVGRLQVAVALLVPLPRDLGMRRPQVVAAFQHLAVAAVGAAAVGAAGPVVGGYLPCVPTPASPPDPPRAAGDDAVGPQVAVVLEIPFSHELGMRGGQVVEAAQQLAVLQYGQLSSTRMERMLTFSDRVGKVGVSEADRTALEGNGLRPRIWNCDITDSWKGRRPQWRV